MIPRLGSRFTFTERHYRTVRILLSKLMINAFIGLCMQLKLTSLPPSHPFGLSTPTNLQRRLKEWAPGWEKDILITQPIRALYYCTPRDVIASLTPSLLLRWNFISMPNDRPQCHQPTKVPFLPECPAPSPDSPPLNYGRTGA